MKNQENYLLEFPEVDVLDQGIDQAFSSLRLKKEFFKKNRKKNKLTVFLKGNNGVRKIEVNCWIVSEKALITENELHIPLSTIVAVA